MKLANSESIVGSMIGRSDVKKNEAGLEVPYYGLTPIAVTRENMDEIIIKSGFHLRDEVYLNVE